MPELKIPDELAEFLDDENSDVTREQIGRLSDDAFKDHVIETVIENDEAQTAIYRCARPGTGIYHFYVAFTPHAISVYGDIGGMMLRPGFGRGEGWLRGALNSGNATHFGYLFEKVPSRQSLFRFYPGDVLASAIWHIEQARDEDVAEEVSRWQKVLDRWAEAVAPKRHDAWCEAAYLEGWEGEDFSGFRDADENMYWSAFALRWFVRARLALETEAAA